MASRSIYICSTHRIAARSQCSTPSWPSGGTTVAFALWYFLFGTFSSHHDLFVEDMFVEPAHRGSGIGLALFRHISRNAVGRDCLDLEWRVLNWNTPAIEFYRRIGAGPMKAGSGTTRRRRIARTRQGRRQWLTRL